MLKPFKRAPAETLEKLKAIRTKYRRYRFELVGTQPSNMPLKDIGVGGLEDYYLAKVQKYESLKTKQPTLRNYCCLFLRMLRGLSRGDKSAVCETDVQYTIKTILALNAKVKTKTEGMEAQIKGMDLESANKTFNEIRSLVLAMGALSSNEFIAWTQSKRNERLVKEARAIVARYRELGFMG